MPQVLAAELKTEDRGAISPAAIWRATPASTTSVHPEVAPTTIRALDCSIPHRKMIRHRMITMTTATTWISIPMIPAATATTPDRFQGCKQNRRSKSGGRFLSGRNESDHDDLCADIDAAVQIDHILIAHPD